MVAASHNRRIILGTMTDKEIALEVAKVILQLHVKKVAFASFLERLRELGYQIDWQPEVQKAYDELLSEFAYVQRISELETAFGAATRGDDLIRILHGQ